MATVIIACDSAPNSSSFRKSASVRVTYTTSGGTLKITEIEVKRTDGYTTYNYDTSSCSVTVGGVTKTVSINQSMFGPSWKKFEATDTTWSSITYSSVNITVKMPSGSLAHSSAEFKTDSEIAVPASTYTISYNANGGTGAPSSQTKTYNKTLTLSSTIPTRASVQEEDTLISYTFKGWATSKTGSVAYKAGGSYTKNASATLYAVWSTTSTVNKFDVVYNTGTGRTIPSQVKTQGTALTLTTTVPNKNGFTFKHWNTAEDGSGTGYTSGASYTTEADVILYAIFTPWTHTVQFNANGGDSSSIPSSFTKTGGVEATLSDAIPTRTGYVFRYWNTASDGSGTKYYDGEEYNFEKNSGTVTLYAIWALDNISIGLQDKICKAIYFEENADLLGFGNTSKVIAGELIEGSSVINIKPGVMMFSELIEK